MLHPSRKFAKRICLRHEVSLILYFTLSRSKGQEQNQITELFSKRSTTGSMTYCGACQGTTVNLVIIIIIVWITYFHTYIPYIVAPFLQKKLKIYRLCSCKHFSLPLERTTAAAAATAAARASTAPLIDSSLFPRAPLFVPAPLFSCESVASPGSWADTGKLLDTQAWRMFLLPSHLSCKAVSKITFPCAAKIKGHKINCL